MLVLNREANEHVHILNGKFRHRNRFPIRRFYRYGGNTSAAIGNHNLSGRGAFDVEYAILIPKLLDDWTSGGVKIAVFQSLVTDA